MAESGKRCAVFAGLTLNGDSYHDFCWKMRDTIAPQPASSKGRATDSNTATRASHGDQGGGKRLQLARQVRDRRGWLVQS
jgi:hypothetical protein